MRVITDRSARLRCGAIVKMCMERDLLYRYFDGDTTPDEERRIMEWAEASPENYRLYLEERGCGAHCCSMPDDGRRAVPRSGDGWRHGA